MTAPSLSAAQLYAQGREKLLLFDVEGYRDAVAIFLEALADDPELAPARAALAEAYAYWAWRREIAGSSCETYYRLAYENACRALERAPDSADSHRAMAVALRAGRLRDPARRLEEARAAQELNRYSAENCHELWRARGADPGDPLAERAIALSPSLCGAHIDLAVALTEAGRDREAVYHLSKALEINPRNGLARYDLAMVWLRLGRAPAALEQLEKAREEHPGEPLIERGLALVRRELQGARA